ncbi:MAG: hypothetical protein FWD15_04670 [Alphaproteobacteria bacterium]|nr:hypothetical protein [Alphaproteobacteria bacterium]
MKCIYDDNKECKSNGECYDTVCMDMSTFNMKNFKEKVNAELAERAKGSGEKYAPIGGLILRSGHVFSEMYQAICCVKAFGNQK